MIHTISESYCIPKFLSKYADAQFLAKKKLQAKAKEHHPEFTQEGQYTYESNIAVNGNDVVKCETITMKYTTP